jgi:hypothetical protein
MRLSVEIMRKTHFFHVGARFTENVPRERHVVPLQLQERRERT